MSVNKALYNILEGKLDDMRSNFSSALSTKAVEKLEERKIDIAQKYFGQMQEEAEELDEVLDTVPKAVDHINKHNASHKKAIETGDKNTMRKREKGEELLKNLSRRNAKKYAKQALGKKGK